jgi:hypothetical protein
MRLSRPKNVTWWIAVILGAAGVLGKLGVIPVLGSAAFWLVFAGFLLLVLATLFKGL